MKEGSERESFFRSVQWNRDFCCQKSSTHSFPIRGTAEPSMGILFLFPLCVFASLRQGVVPLAGRRPLRENSFLFLSVSLSRAEPRRRGFLLSNSLHDLRTYHLLACPLNTRKNAKFRRAGIILVNAGVYLKLECENCHKGGT